MPDDRGSLLTTSVSVALAGSGGSGEMTAGTLLLTAAANAGYYGLMVRTSGPQIRGGEAAALMRIASRPIEGLDDRFDALLAAGGPHVSANEEWVPYGERLSWLCSGKVAIMLHRPTKEADYSIRTRLFDAIAAGLPVVATARGWAAELVEKERKIAAEKAAGSLPLAELEHGVVVGALHGQPSSR